MSVKIERYKREEYEKVQIELDNPLLEQELDTVLKMLKKTDIDRMKPEDAKQFEDRIDRIAIEIQSIFSSQKLHESMLQLQTMNPTLLQTLQNIVTSANEILDTKDVKRKKNKFEDLVKKIKEAYGLLKRIIKETSELAPVVSVIVEAFIKVIKLILETF